MHSLDPSRIRAITLDLDDTLWPIWPTIARAEKVLARWLAQHAPQAATGYASEERRLALRAQAVQALGDRAHDLGAIRTESIRLALHQAGEDPALAEAAFEVFLAERHRVELFADVAESLAYLAGRYPLVAVSNGNADLARVGLAQYFRAGLSASVFGVGKPDARIFLAGAEAAGVAPGEVLHVGDDPSLDVLGAHAVGMQTAWVNRGEDEWPHPVQPHARVADLRELCALLG